MSMLFQMCQNSINKCLIILQVVHEKCGTNSVFMKSSDELQDSCLTDRNSCLTEKKNARHPSRLISFFFFLLPR